MKKIIFTFLFIFLTIFIVSQEAQANISLRKEIRNTIREAINQDQEASVSPKEIRNEIREEVKEKNQGIFDRIKNMIKNSLKFNARETGTISSIGENSFVINTKEGKTLTINITSETKLIRRFGGKSNLTEFSVGNEINVFGKYTNEEQTIIEARLVRNTSIQKRWGAFFGKVTSKGNDSFVMETIKRETQTVYFSSTTKFINRKEQAISYNDIQLNHRVRVKGVWDRTLNKITEVEEVKNFSLPVLPTVTKTQ